MAQTLASEELQLLEQLEAGIALVDSTGRIVLWNRSAEGIFGLPAGDVVGRNWEESLGLVAGDLATSETIRPALKRAEGWQGRVRIKPKTGESKWIQARIQPARIEGKTEEGAWAAIFWPIKSSHPTAGETVPGELAYSDFFRLSPDALFLCDLQARIVEANETALRMLGKTNDELKETPLPSFFEHWRESDTNAARAEARTSGSIIREVTIKLANDERRQVELIASLVVPGENGLLLMRLHDLKSVRQTETLLRNLDELADLARSHLEVQEIATQAAEMVAQVWQADAAVVLTTEPEAVGVAAGPAFSQADRNRLASIGPSGRLTTHLLKVGGPLVDTLGRGR